MLKTLSYYAELSLLTEGLMFLPKLLIDRLAYSFFYKFYYRRKFRFYGRKIYWGKHNCWRRIPRSVRIGNPHLISIGDCCQIDEGVYLQANGNGDGIFIGNNVRINAHTHILAGKAVLIKDKVLIAPRVLISSLNHGTEGKMAIKDQSMKLEGTLEIGGGSWIGQGSHLVGNLSLAPMSVVGAGSVVTKSFKHRGLIAGVPAKMVKTYE